MGRWAPCCSTAPQGTTQTLPRPTASLISGQVSFSYRYSVAAREALGRLRGFMSNVLIVATQSGNDELHRCPLRAGFRRCPSVVLNGAIQGDGLSPLNPIFARRT